MEFLFILYTLSVLGILTFVILLAVNFKKALYFGVIFTAIYNYRYFVLSMQDAIAMFIAVYDPLDNFLASDPSKIPYLAQCNEPNNICSIFSNSTYSYHPNWGVTFYTRFTKDASRLAYLYSHIFFITFSFVTMMAQFYNPGGARGGNSTYHKIVGSLSILSILIGVVSAYFLFSDHCDEPAYAGCFSMYGFAFMGICVLTCVIIGRYKAFIGDLKGHQIWMTRFAGSMWGAFWIFRALEVLTGFLLRFHKTLSLQIVIWFSAPLGILVAEWYQNNYILNKKDEDDSIPLAEIKA